MNRPKTELVMPIAEILAEFDIMDLREGNPDIVDEYRPEAEDIAKRLQGAFRGDEAVSFSEMPDMLVSVFEHWFATEFNPTEFEALARRVHRFLLECA